MLNRNGQSITLAAALKGKVQADPKALLPMAMEAKAKGQPLTFAMTFPPGTHAMWIRYWLGAGGINPDKDEALLKALDEAGVWLDDMKNRPEQAELVSKATYINCPPASILPRMQGHYDFGDGRKKDDPNY